MTTLTFLLQPYGYTGQHRAGRSAAFRNGWQYLGQHCAPLRRDQLISRVAFVAFGLGLPVLMLGSALLLAPTGAS